jgi:hypothetical protein
VGGTGASGCRTASPEADDHPALAISSGRSRSRDPPDHFKEPPEEDARGAGADADADREARWLLSRALREVLDKALKLKTPAK